MRTIISLVDSMWEYRADPEGKGMAEKWYEKSIPDDTLWKKCLLLQAAGLMDRAIFHHYKGEIWFWRRVIISKEMNDRYLELVVDRAWPCCEVFLDGKSLGKQEIPRQGFRVRIPKTVVLETPLALMIRVFGIETKLDDPVTSYFGILDSVYFLSRGHLQCIANRINISGIDSNPPSGKVKIEFGFDVATSFDVDVYAQLELKIWKENKEIFKKLENFKAAKDSLNTVTVIAELNQPKLWSPEDPQLYDMEVLISRTNQKQDNLTAQFGIRDLSLEGSTVLVNKKPVLLKGVKYSPVYPNCGSNIPLSLIKEDFRIMKSLGFNCILMTLPPTEPILMLAGQLGLLIVINAPLSNLVSVAQRAQPHPCAGLYAAASNEELAGLRPLIGDQPLLNLLILTDPAQIGSIGGAPSVPALILIQVPVTPGRTTHGRVPLEPETGEYHGYTIAQAQDLLKANPQSAGI